MKRNSLGGIAAAAAFLASAPFGGVSEGWRFHALPKRSVPTGPTNKRKQIKLRRKQRHRK